MWPGLRVVVGVMFISFLAVPICYFLTQIRNETDSLKLFILGVIICGSVFPLGYLLLRGLAAEKQLSHLKTNLWFYIWTLFSFTAVVDLLIGLTLDNFTDIVEFYLEEGEVYLKTGHGAFIDYWDGTVHYGLYLYMIYNLVQKTPCRFLTLFWVGSIVNSTLVLLPGAIIGKFGDQVKFSYLLNTPYAIFPIYCGYQVIQSRRFFIAWFLSFGKQSQSKTNKPKALVNQGATVSTVRFFDQIFVLYFLGASIFFIYRFFVVMESPSWWTQWWFNVEPYLKDPTKYPKLQVIVQAYYYIPFYLLAARALTSSSNPSEPTGWLPDWAAIFAGASAQSQFSYIGAAVHQMTKHPEPTWQAIPDQHQALFWILNLGLVVFPQLFALRCCWGSNPTTFYNSETNQATDAKNKKIAWFQTMGIHQEAKND